MPKSGVPKRSKLNKLRVRWWCLYSMRHSLGLGVTNIGETLLMLSKVERFSRGFWFREKELGKGSPYTLSLNIHWKSIGRWCRSWENLYRFCHLNSSWFSLFANLQIVVGEIYILFAINLQSQNNANCDFRRMFLKYLIFIWILWDKRNVYSIWIMISIYNNNLRVNFKGK